MDQLEVIFLIMVPSKDGGITRHKADRPGETCRSLKFQRTPEASKLTISILDCKVPQFGLYFGEDILSFQRRGTPDH
jgi:hypothetical protein